MDWLPYAGFAAGTAAQLAVIFYWGGKQNTKTEAHEKALAELRQKRESDDERSTRLTETVGGKLSALEKELESKFERTVDKAVKDLQNMLELKVTEAKSSVAQEARSTLRLVKDREQRDKELRAVEEKNAEKQEGAIMRKLEKLDSDMDGGFKWLGEKLGTLSTSVAQLETRVVQLERAIGLSSNPRMPAIRPGSGGSSGGGSSSGGDHR